MIDLTGQQFGRLKVLSQAGCNKWRIGLWLCKCVCGNTKIIPGSDLRSDSTKSCGCLRREGNNTRHGQNRDQGPTKTYKSWNSLKQRCTNPGDKDYKSYGGRGIAICEEWLEFSNFFKDMGKCPPGYSIDRIDNDKGYDKNNCRWSTRKQQARNRGNNHLETFDGKTKCLAEWAEETGISSQVILDRLNKSWSIEEALTTSVRKR